MLQYIFAYRRRMQYLLIAGDCLSIVLSIVIAYHIRFASKKADFDFTSPTFITLSLFIVGIHIFTLYCLGQYSLEGIKNTVKSIIYIGLGVLLANLIISGVMFFFPKYIIGRRVLVMHAFFAPFIIICLRKVLAQIFLKRALCKRVALVGDSSITSKFMADLTTIPDPGLEVSALYVPTRDAKTDHALKACHCELMGDIDSLLTRDDCDAIAFDTTADFLTQDQIRAIIENKYRGKAIYDLPVLYQNLTGKVPLGLIDGRWLLSNTRFHGEQNPLYKKFKRAIDLCISLTLLLLLLPVVCLLAVLIKLDSRGPVFFVQERLGYQKRPFRCCKFRTMKDKAEAQCGPVWSSSGDDRVTRLGRVMRKTRLDEIPQLFNVLIGDMSFVGPRPIRQHFADQLAKVIPFYDLRFSVKPGLTGWAQVNHGYAGSEEGQLEKFQYELFYIQNMSFFLDLLVLIKTFRTVIKGTGE